MTNVKGVFEKLSLFMFGQADDSLHVNLRTVLTNFFLFPKLTVKMFKSEKFLQTIVIFYVAWLAVLLMILMPIHY